MSINQPQPPTSHSAQPLLGATQPAPVPTPSPALSAGQMVQQPLPQQHMGMQLSGQQKPTPPQKKNTWTGFAGKTLWDWMELAGSLLVPFMIGVFTLAVTAQQNQISQSQHNSDQQIAMGQQQEATLKAYFDDMTDLMINKGLRQSKPDDEVRVVARAKTLTALRVLNGDRKGTLLRFLYEAKLIGGQQQKAGPRYDVVISLDGADLSSANLSGADLHGAVLSLTNLQRASLGGAILSGASLYQTNLQDANLQGTYLDSADLQGADLRNTALQGSNLDTADLKGAKVAKEQLASAYRLTHATLPDGSIYPSQSYPVSNHIEP